MKIKSTKVKIWEKWPIIEEVTQCKRQTRQELININQYHSMFLIVSQVFIKNYFQLKQGNHQEDPNDKTN